MQEKQVGCSQSAVLWISDGIGGRRCRFPHRSILENSADSMQMRLMTKILNLCGCSHILEIVFQTEGHPFAAQCLSVLRGCDGKEVNGMAMDEELYRQYLCGDEAGLVALMKKYGNPLTLYINGYLHDVHEAEDLMIEVFSYLFTKKPRIRDGGLKAYLYKAARHMALRGRSRRRLFFSLDNLTEEPDGQTLVEEVVRTKERDRILHFCMAALNPDYREALYLVYFEGMSYLQAAEVMGKSEKQITNMVYRGKGRLRGLLEREGITNAES